MQRTTGQRLSRILAALLTETKVVLALCRFQRTDKTLVLTFLKRLRQRRKAVNKLHPACQTKDVTHQSIFYRLRRTNKRRSHIRRLFFRPERKETRLLFLNANIFRCVAWALCGYCKRLFIGTNNIWRYYFANIGWERVSCRRSFQELYHCVVLFLAQS